MLGFPPEAYDDLLEWSDDLIRGTTAGADPAVAKKAMEASAAFRQFQLGVIADRRSKPQQDDLVSILCHAEIDGHRLDDESVVQETLLILIGGDETTRHVISTGMLALMERPDQRDRDECDAGFAHDRGRRAAPLGHADQEHVAHRGA